jgi:hypothetical protein
MTKIVNILCLLAVCAVGFSAATGRAFGDGLAGTPAQSVKELTKSIALPLNGTLSLETFKGSITIKTWASPMVELHAVIEPDGTSAQDLNNVSLTDVEIQSSASTLRIWSDYDKLTSRTSTGASDDEEDNLPLIIYTITMPASAALNIRDHKSVTEIIGLKSALSINTHKGNVLVSGLEGSIDLSTHKGDAKVEFARVTGESRFESFKGDVRIVIPRELGFNLDSDLGSKASLRSDHALTNVQGHMGSGASVHAAVNGGGPLIALRGDKAHFELRER